MNNPIGERTRPPVMTRPGDRPEGPLSRLRARLEDETVQFYLRRLVFIGLLGVLGYGVVSNPAVRDGNWMSHGRKEFFEFSAGFFALSAFFYYWKAPYFPAFVLVLGLLAAVSAVGLGPVAAAAALLFSCFVLGDLLTGSETASDQRFPGVGVLLSVLLGAAIYSTSIGIAAHFRVNYPAVYWTVLVLPLLVHRGGALRGGRLMAGGLSATAWEGADDYAAYSLLVFALAFHLLWVLMPEVLHDALSTHLVVPHYIAYNHVGIFDAQKYIWAVMPMAADWLFTAAFMLGGEFAARLINLSFLLLAAALLYRLCRGFSGRAVALSAVALYVSTPFLQLETGSLFVENIWSAFTLGGVAALCLFHGRRDAASLWMLAALMGAALAAKIFTGPILGVVSIFLLWDYIKEGKQTTSVLGVLGAVAVLAVFGGYPYLFAWHATGNPVFPYMNEIFKSPFFQTGKAFNNAAFNSPLRWSTLYDLTINSHNYLEGADGAFGLGWLVLLPLSLLSIRRGYPYIGVLSWAISLAAFPAIFHFQSYLRYFAPLLPLWIIVIALSWVDFQKQDGRFFRWVLAFAWMAVVANAYCMPASGWAFRDLHVAAPFSSSAREEYLRFFAPERKVSEYLNVRYGRYVRVCYFSRPYYADLEGDGLSPSWHDNIFASKLAQSKTADDVARLMEAYSVDRFVSPTAQDSVKMHPAAADFLARYTEPEFEYGSILLSRLKGEYTPARDLVRDGGFQGAAQAWQKNGDVVFPAAGGSCIVDNHDTLVQAVAIDDRTIYRYVMKARCADPGGQVRLQVNWQDKQGKFLGTSIVVRDCSAQYAEYSADMRPPQGTVSGGVYVGTQDPHRVEVAGVSLRY